MNPASATFLLIVVLASTNALQIRSGGNCLAFRKDANNAPRIGPQSTFVEQCKTGSLEQSSWELSKPFDNVHGRSVFNICVKGHLLCLAMGTRYSTVAELKVKDLSKTPQQWFYGDKGLANEFFFQNLDDNPNPTHCAFLDNGYLSMKDCFTGKNIVSLQE